MIKKAIRMNLNPGAKAEYQKRHDELWPEMREMLKEHGALSYSIFLDPKSNQLFGYLEIEDEEKWKQVSTTAINQKWWTYMKELMETNPDDSPVSIDLESVFEL
ncbi:L-rhamnose mutarotase [Enterococcus raffinosus]|uniref:L-rhamnose mutarotase n=1 Tax=Enterococcus raffinosus TaxID=71452 RepID=UPI001C11C756|nr:L-rhamnose mutarotase [Enterococcus raffinosus]MBU5361079.1 L-rhamnose mutarotase [Enterococcus raffinosus]